jgi:AraC-like DNA-binding protein
MQFMEMVDYLNKNQLLLDNYQFHPQNDLYDFLSDKEFEDFIDLCPLALYTWEEGSAPGEVVAENNIIPESRDVFVLRHFRHTKLDLHSHNFFEISYVFRGKCRLSFEKTFHELGEGELCIIAPYSSHDIEIEDDDTTVITILIRKSTFNSTFFSLLSQKDLLSYFFRTILYGNSNANYLLFFTENTEALKKIIKNLTIENFRNDPYTNNCCISWVNLLFSIVLRNYGQTIQFYDYELGSDFSLILQYIQRNYLNLSLAELARHFHYSESHLSILIRKNTGHSFSELVKRLKMADAMDYLKNTSMKISEIAEATGYNSNDHFSRVFRSFYGKSPQEFRKDSLS